MELLKYDTNKNVIISCKASLKKYHRLMMQIIKNNKPTLKEIS